LIEPRRWHQPPQPFDLDSVEADLSELPVRHVRKLNRLSDSQLLQGFDECTELMCSAERREAAFGE